MKVKIRIAAILLLLIALAVLALDNRLLVRKYQIDAPELDGNLRIALITDLHSCKYGEKQTELIAAISAQNPDVVMFSGDIFDDEIPDDNTAYLISGIADQYPCYYVSGNHEYWAGQSAYDEKMAILEEYGVTVLSGNWEMISVSDAQICICGVSDPEAAKLDPDYSFTEQLALLDADRPENVYTILLSHRPEYIETYAEYGFDLVLSGHAHGGQVRIPLLLNGLYAPNQGFFPKYAGGKFDSEDTTMIVSRGLARESTRLPRIFNRPELVIVDINKE